jgi:hypothetical protein
MADGLYAVRMHEHMHVTTRDTVTVDGHTVPVHPLAEPLAVGIAIPRETEQKLLIHATLGQVVRVPRQQVVRRPWHFGNLPNDGECYSLFLLLKNAAKPTIWAELPRNMLSINDINTVAVVRRRNPLLCGAIYQPEHDPWKLFAALPWLTLSRKTNTFFLCRQGKECPFWYDNATD